MEEESSTITSEHEAYTHPEIGVPQDDTEKEEAVVLQEEVKPVAKKHSPKRYWVFLLPACSYICAFCLGILATFQFLYAKNLPTAVSWFLIAVAMGFIGHIMLIAALFLVAEEVPNPFVKNV